MTIERTIKGMRAPDLRKLYAETVDKIQAIEKAHARIAEIKQSAENTHAEVERLETKANLERIVAESQNHLQEIKGFHSKVFAGNEDAEKPSIKLHLENLLEFFEKRNDELNSVKTDMLGGVREDEEGNEQKILGYINEIKEKIRGHEDKYKEIYERIENELLSGATTVGLAKHFNAKMKEYATARKKLERVLVGLFALGFVGLGFLAVFVSYPTDWHGWGVSLLRYAPIFSLFVWLVVLVGNRRAENHKLEESYKHKEVMAQSFTGYKKSIEDIESLNEEDAVLLKKLMHDLLDAIKKDSSAFLSAKGEGPPATDVAKKFLKTKGQHTE